MSTCRSCGAEIKWAVTPAGKKMPLDAEPVTDQGHLGGLQLLVQRRNPDPQGDKYIDPLAVPVTRVGNPDELVTAWAALYRSHFATCSHPERHRKPR